MPLYCPSGKWRHEGKEFACRGDIPKPLLGSGMMDDPVGSQISNVQHRSGSCHHDLDNPEAAGNEYGDIGWTTIMNGHNASLMLIIFA